MTNSDAKKKSSLAKQRGLIIGLAVAFATLLLGYFFIVRPLMNNSGDVDTTTSTPKIWGGEQMAGSGRLALYPSVEREDIVRIDIHNPKNGDRYADWGIYYNEKADETNLLEADTFYLIDYEYAPLKNQSLTYMLSAAGTVLCTARIEDHCTNFAKYGLTDGTLGDDDTYMILTKKDGGTHTLVFGDKLPSGSGYYIRSLDEDAVIDPETGRETGERAIRDSVYILYDLYVSTTLLSSPTKITTPLLAYPAVDNTRLQSFGVWIYDEKYYTYETDENGEQVIGADGKPVRKLSPFIYAKPTDTTSHDPFSVFNGLSVYNMLVPNGYYSSTAFEGLIDMFTGYEEDNLTGKFAGSSVVELAKLQYNEDGSVKLDEDGHKVYAFDDETFKKYYLDNPYCRVNYTANDIENVVYFSPLQEGSYYYAYSVVFDTISRVELSSAYFLEWDLKGYISSNIIYLMITNCKTIEVSGKYFDLGVDNSDREGEQEVNFKFELDNSGGELTVTEANSGKKLDTKLFRKYYRVLVDLCLREELDDETIAEAKKNEPMATIRIDTAETTVKKTDEAGKETDVVDFVRPSVARVYRFYEISNGRVLLTIENIDETGKSEGESGDFYLVRGSVEKLLSSAIDLVEGNPIDPNVRG